MITVVDIWEEFSMSKYASRSERDNAMAEEIVKLRNEKSIDTDYLEQQSKGLKAWNGRSCRTPQF